LPEAQLDTSAEAASAAFGCGDDGTGGAVVVVSAGVVDVDVVVELEGATVVMEAVVEDETRAAPPHPAAVRPATATAAIARRWRPSDACTIPL
jgi:hypothetical protein